MIGRRREAEGNARRELLELGRTVEIGAGRAHRHAATAEHRRSAAQVALPQDRGLALVPGVAATQRQAQLVGDVIGRIGENGVGFGIDVGFRESGEAVECGEQAHVELRVGSGIEVVAADQDRERTGIVEQLQFLAELLVAIEGGHVEIDRGQRVEVDGRGAVILAPTGDRTDRQCVRQVHGEIGRDAVGFHVLLRIGEAAAGIVNVVQHRRARAEAWNEAMAAALVALVPGVVAGDADRPRLSVIARLDGAARGPDVLVVILLARGEVLAEAAARKPRHRTAHAHQVSQRCGRRQDRIGPVIGAKRSLQLYRYILRQQAGDIFHRAADGVAAIQRALRTAQHLDPLHIVDVQHCGLRAVEIDIVEIDAHTLLEAGNRVLLADAADEGRKRRVGAARFLQRRVGAELRDFSDIDRAALFQFLRPVGRDRDRHVDQPFLAPARGDHDGPFAGTVGDLVCLRCGIDLRMNRYGEGKRDRTSDTGGGMPEDGLAHLISPR